VAPTRSTVRFEIDRLDERVGDARQVVPVLDGRSLVEIVDELETRRGYEPAGGYAGLVPGFFSVGDLKRYYLAKQEPWTGSTPVAVLGCECGELGCWPLHARIVVTDDEVTWRDFQQPHRAQRDYSGLGPFTFDRGDYERAVQEVVDRLATSE
jgi:hypothetical protein